MAKEIGQLNVKIGLDSSGFQNGISSLNREMRKVQSEFKLASAEMGKHGKELDSLKLRSDSLTKQTELQRQKVQALEAAHQKSVETKGEDAKATQDLEIKLNRAKTQLAYMEQDLKKVNQEIEVQSSGWYKLSKSLEPLGQSMQQIGKRMESVGKSLSMKITAPLVGLGTVAVKVGSDFEAGMSQVQAISGATGEDLKRLEEKAKEMGATTKFSASEASEGLKYMAMAGWDTTQMLDGLEGVMMLAAASGEDLGLVSDIVTDALTAFGMEAREASQFADLLASASSNSNTNVAMLGESFKYVAPLFGALGYSAEDAALALGLMANAGIKGSQAGTSLKTAIANLANPTDKMATAIKELGISITDSSGHMLPFKDVMDELRVKFADLTEEQQAQYAATIFGKEAMSGMLAIINTGEADYSKLTTATRSYTGTAKEMAEMMEDNLQGGITVLKSGLEGLAINIFEILLPHLNKLVGMLQRLVDWFANLSPATQESIVKVATLAAAIGPLVLIGGKLIGAFGSVVGTLSSMSGALALATTGAAAATPAVGALAGAFTVLTGPVGIAVTAIAGLTIAGAALYKHLNQVSIPAIELFGDKVSESTKQAVGGFLELNDQATLALNQLSWSEEIKSIVESTPIFPSGRGNKGIYYQKYLIHLLCHQPFWLDSFIESREIVAWIGGMTFPLILPTAFAMKGSKTVNIVNESDVEVPVSIEFKGPATNPRVTNKTTGQYIQVNRELVLGDVLVITTDFGAKRVEINGENVFNWIDLGSYFWQLQPGDNIIEYSSDDPVEPTAVMISYRNRYVGV